MYVSELAKRKARRNENKSKVREFISSSFFSVSIKCECEKKMTKARHKKTENWCLREKKMINSAALLKISKNIKRIGVM